MIMTELDLIFARGRLSLDYRMSAPQFNHGSETCPRGARDTPCSRRSSEARHLWPARPVATPPAGVAVVAADSPALAPEAGTGSAGSSGRDRGLEIPPFATERTVVPIDLNLGVRFRILVVTGPEHGRQDGGAQDGGSARDHGPVGFARSRRRGFAVSDLSTTCWPTSVMNKAWNSRCRRSRRT